jgi:hypothetical protein
MSGVPVNARNKGLRQCAAHIQGQGIVLAAMRLVGQNDHVTAVTKHFGGLKLLDQREDVAMVPA